MSCFNVLVKFDLQAGGDLLNRLYKVLGLDEWDSFKFVVIPPAVLFKLQKFFFLVLFSFSVFLSAAGIRQPVNCSHILFECFGFAPEFLKTTVHVPHGPVDIFDLISLLDPAAQNGVPS